MPARGFRWSKTVLQNYFVYNTPDDNMHFTACSRYFECSSQEAQLEPITGAVARLHGASQHVVLFSQHAQYQEPGIKPLKAAQFVFNLSLNTCGPSLLNAWQNKRAPTRRAYYLRRRGEWLPRRGRHRALLTVPLRTCGIWCVAKQKAGFRFFLFTAIVVTKLRFHHRGGQKL